MREDIARAIAALGNTIDPDLIAASYRLYAPFHARERPPGITVTRDARYGPAERQRLDLFVPARQAEPCPVFLFVPGGGFVGGDKRTPGTPYHDNAGRWAAARGFAGVTMNYRLAPAARYPAAAEDVASALAWITANAAAFGGDPGAIVVAGTSAGATHAATYVARRDLWPGARSGVAGLILISGFYAFSGDQPPNVVAYFGDDPAAASPLAGLAAADVPLLFSVAEFDPPPFHAQAMHLAQARYARDGRFPEIAVLAGHNHITPVAQLDAGAAEDPGFSALLADFVRRVARAPRTAGAV